MGEYEDDYVKMKVLPDGRAARADGVDLDIVDGPMAASEIRRSRDAYRERIEDLKSKLAGTEAALHQIDKHGTDATSANLINARPSGNRPAGECAPAMIAGGIS